MSAWTDLDPDLRSPGMSLKWIGNDNRPDIWNIAGFMEGDQGAWISGPIKGLVHRPFKTIWHSPAYGPPRFERSVDERREISTRIALASDSEFGWQDVESRFWNGMNETDPGFLTCFTRRTGELWLPMQLLDAVETELTEDPGYENHVQEWDILLGVDGDPRWRMPDLRPPEWFWSNLVPADRYPITTAKYKGKTYTARVGKFKVANRGTADTWPIYTLSAPMKGTKPARWWISNGSTAEMIPVPPLYKGEHIVVDTNPEHRIAISAIDPVDNGQKQFIRNADLLKWLFGQYGDSGVSILERFHGQGFNVPCKAGEVSTLTVYCDTPFVRASVRLPQRYERAIS
jgi:hypothetical protein